MNHLEQQDLLRLARESICTHFKKEQPDLNESKYNDMVGAFVSLHKEGQLRGCIGYPEPVLPLGQAIVRLSRAAAFEDPRFPPVSRHEINELQIEISILSKPHLLDCKPEVYEKNITIGRDGLILRGTGQGLLLPQVAREQGWDARQFLDGICMKSCLGAGEWKNQENKIFTFQATVFSEKDINK